MREADFTGNKTFMRRSEAQNALGLTRYQLEALVESGTLRQEKLPGMSQGMFRTVEIIKLQKEYKNEDGNN